MSTWLINYTETATIDLNAIDQYITFNLLAPLTAMKQTNRILDAVDTLKEMPYRNPLYDKEPWKSKGLRKLLVDNYIVLYTTEETSNEILIRHIFYSGRKIDDILK